MTRGLLLIAILVMLIAGCSRSQGEPGKQQDAAAFSNAEEFNVLCEQFTALIESGGYPSMSSEQRAEDFNDRLRQRLNTDGGAYLAWSAIRNGPPEARYELYKEAAASVGYPEWNCQAIKDHGASVGSTFD